MARKRYSIYKLTAPSGRSYVGFTSQDVAERWRQHVSRSRRNVKHPLCAAITKHGADAFVVETIASYENLEEALRAEIDAISCLEAPYNVSAGGEFDGGAGAARFRELLKNPEWRAEYVVKLSAGLKASAAFKESRERLKDVLPNWRRDNPTEAHRLALRALRIGANKTGCKSKPVAGRIPREPKGKAAKLHKSRASRDAAKRHWAEMPADKKADITARISASVAKVHAQKTPSEVAAHVAQLAKARESIDHNVRKTRQQEALKAYWTPERRAAFGAEVKARRGLQNANV